MDYSGSSPLNQCVSAHSFRSREQTRILFFFSSFHHQSPQLMNIYLPHRRPLSPFGDHHLTGDPLIPRFPRREHLHYGIV